MSRIDDLIKRHAPDGVEYRALGDVVRIKNGKDHKPLSDGDVPVYGSGGIMRYADTYAYDKPSVLIPRKGSLGNLFYVDVPFWTVDTIFYTEIEESLILPKFLYHYLCTVRLGEMNKAGGVPSQTQSVLNKIRVPVPPIEIQREIVRILDAFTELEAELETELEAELGARRQQYAHYWDYLLTPRDHWRELAIGDVAEVFDGPHATPKKVATGPWYLSISSLNSGWFDLSKSAHLSEADFRDWTRRVAAEYGDTMFSYETRIGQAAMWDRHEPAALGRRMGVLRPRSGVIEPRFLTFAYLGPQVRAVIKAKTVSGSTVDRIPIADIAKWPIRVPPVDEQRRLVEMLSEFDALVNDLSSGLPAEIEARRQQHAYYRDRLLSFEEVVA